ncbi:TrmH family RNA methyltransferase [Haloflavibacter putidus]|uniref:RNA methyltransferase n=1 Tax=Haloflavibacter putidus TaxID=2576776 RepID=A0A507ZRU8_9FLAO|nr:RNA methyltransferase [Haloflavibacter putidus]TQD36302.1 RNA methyltransferase [Haloflavibacter putidus]
MYKHISSTQNKAIKKLLQLTEKSRNRRKEALFVVEGFREINLALSAGYQLQQLYFSEELLSENNLNALSIEKGKITELSLEVYKKISYRSSTEGVVAVMHTKEHALRGIKFERENPLVLVAEAPEKPGNIGALLRTADAANLDAVFIANPKTDLYNPNIIRSSVGCIFTNQIATGSTKEIIDFLKQKSIAIYCAALQNSSLYTQQNYTNASAIVVGTEADGLEEEWLQNSTKNIIIPMQGKIDSMNVSVAAGILIFEAKRQRKF